MSSYITPISSCRTRRTILTSLLALAVLSCTTISTPEPTLPSENFSATNDVVILPTEDFPFEIAADLAKILASDTGLRIRAMLNLGTNEWQPYANVPQYDPARLKEIALPAINELKKTYGGTLYILLTTKDINSADGGLRFVFAESYPQDKVSVISVARMFFGAPGQPASDQIVTARLRKMTLRTIGLQYFGMPRSANPSDLMYSPLMSLDALDDMEPILRR